jgi:hypothetical protein
MSAVGDFHNEWRTDVECAAAAALLQMSPLTLRKKAAAGKVPASKPFKAWVFVIDELLAFIKQSRKSCIYIDGKTLRTGGSVSGYRGS